MCTGEKSTCELNTSGGNSEFTRCSVALILKTIEVAPLFLSGWNERGLPMTTEFNEGHPKSTQEPSYPGSLHSVLGSYVWTNVESPRSSEGLLTVLTSIRYGTRWETTSTWWGCSPTSSWASRRAVAVSSVSTGSLFPPGKQTSPGDRLSWGIARTELQSEISVWELCSHSTNINSTSTGYKICFPLNPKK